MNTETGTPGTARARKRWVYALLGLLVIALGLGSRSGLVPLSDFVAKYSGDALWALLVFIGFGFLLPLQSTIHIAGLATTFSILIEFSQLYHALWIDSIRRTRIGGLVLGDTFAWADIAAYLVGITCGGCVELLAYGVNQRD